MVTFKSLVLLFIVSFVCCTPTPPQAKLHHVVFVWLNEKATDEIQKRMIKDSFVLKKIPTVLDYQVGTTVMSERAIVDDSFDIGIYVSFQNQQDMQSYLDHPIHQEFVAQKVKPYLKKIVVYDFRDQ